MDYSFLEARVYRVSLPVLKLASFDVFLFGRRFVLRYASEVSLADIRAYLHYREVVPGAAPLDALHDLRVYDFERLQPDDLMKTIEIYQSFAKSAPPRRAHLVADTLGYGLMRQFQIMNDVHGVAAQDRLLVTTSEAEAVAWIGLSDS
ncbi:MAG: hypothetical protein AAF675_01715 [Pseudomonadota bacterium]